jgi:hypothetical protein
MSAPLTVRSGQYFDDAGIEPLYEFGYGLSYST